MEAKAKNGKLIQKLIFVAIAAILGISIVLTIISSININNVYNEMVEEELKVAAEHLQSELNSVWDGDWSYSGGSLYKGEENVMAEYEEIMDELHQETGIEYALFYMDERVLTTMTENGKKLTGYKASADRVSQVINGKQEYYAPQTTVAGSDIKYFAYYAPLTPSDGSPA